jgi:hypothetical protein
MARGSGRNGTYLSKGIRFGVTGSGAMVLSLHVRVGTGTKEKPLARRRRRRKGEQRGAARLT